MAEKVTIELTLEQKQALDSLNKLSTQVKKTGSEGEKSFSKMSSSFSVFAGVIAAKAVTAGLSAISNGIRSITSSMTEFIALSIEQEDAVNALNVSLAQAGEYSEATSKDFQKYAAELQRTSVFGDEVILKNAALIESLGRLDGEGLKKATQAALDFSAALGKDLSTSSQLLGRAASGNIELFSRFGITIQKGKTDAETFANTLKTLNDRYSGAAAAQLETYGGAQKNLANAFSDLKEKVGDLITQNKVFSGSNRGLVKVLEFLQTTILNNRDIFDNFVNKTINFFIEGIGAAGQAVIKFNSVIDASKNFFDRIDIAALKTASSIASFAVSVLETTTKVREYFGLASEGIQETIDLLNLRIDLATQAEDQLNKNIDERLKNEEEFIASIEGFAERAQKIIRDEIALNNKQTSNTLENLNKVGKANKDARKEQKYTDEEKLKDREKFLSTTVKLAESENKALAAIGKAAALTQIAIDTQAAIGSSFRFGSSIGGPPLGFAFAAIAATAMAAQAAKIAGIKLEQGGVVPGIPSARDNQIAAVASGEAVLTMHDQQLLFNAIRSGNFGGGNKPIIVEIDGQAIATAVRNARRDGAVI